MANISPLLNNGYGSAESNYQQSIAVLDLATNQLRDFPDARLAPHARQSYFVGLAWSSDGNELYASMASLTDPEGKKPSSTGNGIAVYRFSGGALTADRFLKLPLVPIAHGRKNIYGGNMSPRATPSPILLVLPLVKGAGGDALLVAENLADDAVLIDARDGKVLQRFESRTRQRRAQHLSLYRGGESRMARAVGARCGTAPPSPNSTCNLAKLFARSRFCRRKRKPKHRPIPPRFCSVQMRSSST